MKGIVSKYTSFYGISKEMLEKLAAHQVEKVKLTFDKLIEGEPKKPEAKALMKMTGCLLAE